MIKLIFTFIMLISFNSVAYDRIVQAGEIPIPRLETGDVVQLTGFNQTEFNVEVTMLRPITMSGGAWSADYFNGKVVTSDNQIMNPSGVIWDVAVMSHGVYDRSSHSFVDASMFEFMAPSSTTNISIRFKSNGGIDLIDQGGRLTNEIDNGSMTWLTPATQVNMSLYEFKWSVNTVHGGADGAGGYVGNDVYQTMSDSKSVNIDVSGAERFYSNRFTMRAKFDHSLSYSGEFYVGYKAIPRVPPVELSLLPNDIIKASGDVVMWPSDSDGFTVEIEGVKYPFTSPPTSSVENRTGYYQVKYKPVAGSIVDGSQGAAYYVEVDTWTTLGGGNEIWLTGKGRFELSFRERQFPSENINSKYVDIVDAVVVAGVVPSNPLLTGQYVKLSGFNDETLNGSVVKMLRPITMSGGAWSADYFNGKTIDGNIISNPVGNVWDVAEFVVK